MRRATKMTPDKIRLVKASFDQVFPMVGTLTETFYEQLFERKPELKSVFPKDLMTQKQKFSDMLSFLVSNLDRPEVIEQTITSLARRHAGYGATVDDFSHVGGALLHALKTHAPEGMEQSVAAAWLETYEFVSDLMIDEMTQTATSAA
jgi:hemoglobin-like flavoprotein